MLVLTQLARDWGRKAFHYTHIVKECVCQDGIGQVGLDAREFVVQDRIKLATKSSCNIIWLPVTKVP